MRRMYSEQELTKIIKVVFEEELESGALDDLVSDAVDAYLVENPVDITALEGKDVELASLDATGLITGGEIVEKMSGYSFSPASNANFTYEYVYAGVVKNGNKITFVIAANLTKGAGADRLASIGGFTIPASVGAKLFPTQVGAYSFLDNKVVAIFSDFTNYISCPCYTGKGSNTSINTSPPVNNGVSIVSFSYPRI